MGDNDDEVGNIFSDDDGDQFSTLANDEHFSGRDRHSYARMAYNVADLFISGIQRQHATRTLQHDARPSTITPRHRVQNRQRTSANRTAANRAPNIRASTNQPVNLQQSHSMFNMLYASLYDDHKHPYAAQAAQSPQIPVPDPKNDIEARAIIPLCVVCQTNAISTVIVPCMHSCLCCSCSNGILHKPMCPICRTDILEINKMYLCAKELDKADIVELNKIYNVNQNIPLMQKSYDDMSEEEKRCKYKIEEKRLNEMD